MLTEGPCLAHYAKDKDNIVTTDASTTELGKGQKGTDEPYTICLSLSLSPSSRLSLFSRRGSLISLKLGLLKGRDNDVEF